MNKQTPNSIKLYETAKNCLGRNMVSPEVPIDLGCASSMNNVYKKAFGKEIGGGASTYSMLQALINGRFNEVTDPLPGDIIISATNTSIKKYPPIYNGHVGVMGYKGIMSNNSMNGLWQEKYTLESWKDRYEKLGGYPTRFFRVI